MSRMNRCPEEGVDEPMWCHRCRQVCCSADCPCDQSHDAVENVIKGLEQRLELLSKQIIKGEFVP